MFGATDGIEGLTLARETSPDRDHPRHPPAEARRLDGPRRAQERPDPGGDPRDHAVGRGAARAGLLVRRVRVPGEAGRAGPARRRWSGARCCRPAATCWSSTTTRPRATLVSRHLRRAGYSTVEARDGEEALLRARVLAPGPRHPRSADARRRRLRGAPHAALEGMRTPVVVLTGKALAADEEQHPPRRPRARRPEGRHARSRASSARPSSCCSPGASSRAHALPRILYVEDSPQNRDIVRRYLAGEYEVIEAEDGEQGLERAARDLPDLVLMDLSLPRLDGWEATRRIKANRPSKHIPVIAVTAHAAREEQTRAYARPAASTTSRSRIDRDAPARLDQETSRRGARARDRAGPRSSSSTTIRCSSSSSSARCRATASRCA